jgi:hypothetical protein
MNVVWFALIIGLILSYFILFRSTTSHIKENFESEDEQNSLSNLQKLHQTINKLAEKVNVVYDKVDNIETFILNRPTNDTVEEEFVPITEEGVDEEYFNEFENNTLKSDESLFVNVYEEVDEEVFEEQNNDDIIEGFVDNASLNCHHL